MLGFETTFMRGRMVLCFRYSNRPGCRAALLNVVLQQTAEKFVPLVQPTAGGNNILERPWREAKNGTWYAYQRIKEVNSPTRNKVFVYLYTLNPACGKPFVTRIIAVW